VQVSGRVTRPSGSRSPLRATLVPDFVEGFEPTIAEESRDLVRLHTTVDKDGAFRFDHVRPDSYQLRIEGKDITPSCSLISVAEHDFDAGSFKIAGTGRIVGTVHVAGGLEQTAWRFADVTLTSEHYSGFADAGDMFERLVVADEDGRFVFENVPAGMNYLVVLYPGFHDYQFPYEWATQVIAEKTTEIRTFERSNERQLAVSITVGDGSREHLEIGSADLNPDHTLLARFRPDLPPPFTLDVTPIKNDSCCFSGRANPGNRNDWNRVVVKDVSPGRYHVRLLAGEQPDQSGGNIVYEADLEPGDQPVRVALDAASIVSKVLGGDSGSVIAIEQNSNQKPRRAGFFGDNDSSIPFVRNGTYLLVAHDRSKGWCIGPQVPVHNVIAQAPAMKLVPGGELRGKIVARTPCPIPDVVVAVDRSGIEIADESYGRRGLTQYRIPQLWPGDWTVQLMRKGEILARARAKIPGTETVTVDLVFDSRRQR
jgi:hypothetical protein